MYPMIPHIRSVRGFPRVLSRVGVLFDESCFRVPPSLDVRLTAARDAERAGGHVLA